jgi:hypothetical protein
MRRHLSIWQCAWAALVVAGHVELMPGLKSNPRWIELVLLVAYGLLVVLFMRDEGLRPRPVRLEAVWRILLAAVETAASMGWLAFAVIIEVAPARTTDGHPTMPLGQAFVAAVMFGLAGILTAVLLMRARSNAVFSTRLALAGCAIVTAISLAR